ncbi:MAG: hydantoinase/oxoprolinase family protein [Thermomicrobiales bacterium]
MVKRLGIDVGGTFTDLALIDSDHGQIITEKVLTTPADPWLGIRDGVQALLARGIAAGDIGVVIHGTTLVINALIERRGAPIGLLTTRGFRDVLAFGREFRYDIYDPDLVLPDPVVPRRLRREVGERTGGDGSIIEPLDREETRRTIRELLGENVEGFAVCLLHAYCQPEHERVIRDLIAQEAPDHPVSLSHEVLPQIREFERCSTTAINAYVQPIIRRYARRLRDGLAEEGFPHAPYLMTSSGNTMTAEAAEAFPVHLVESGPAGGALIAGLIGKQIGAAHVLAFDMGGTTSKACVIRDGTPLVSRSYEVAHVRRFRKGSGLPLGVPVIDLLETGAGGGSIAEIDALGLLRVGPHSAGADPGPACYGRGGVLPTVTDANVVLGLIDPAGFLGGSMTLDASAARTAIEETIGNSLGLDAEAAASAIHRVVTENMAEAIRVHAVEINVDVRSLAMVAYGGAGPLHAIGVARRLQIPSVVFPPAAGVLSALGLLTAPLGFESTLSVPADLADLDVPATNALLAELETRGGHLLMQAGVPADEIQHKRSVDMCYVDQRYEVSTPLPSGPLASNAPDQIKRLFDAAYERSYGRRLDQLPARCMTWRVLSTGPTPPQPFSELGLSPRNAQPIPEDATQRPKRRVVFPDDDLALTAIIDRADLLPGSLVCGPALITESASTIVIPPGISASVDRWGNVVATLSHG